MCVGYLDYECISPDKYIYPQIGLSLHEGHIFAVMINEGETFSSVRISTSFAFLYHIDICFSW